MSQVIQELESMGFDDWVRGKLNSVISIQATKIHFGQLIGYLKIADGGPSGEDSFGLLNSLHWLLGHTSFLRSHFT
jgi:hypothetical protein